MPPAPLPNIFIGMEFDLEKSTHSIKDLEGFPYFILCILSLGLNVDPNYYVAFSFPRLADFGKKKPFFGNIMGELT